MLVLIHASPDFKLVLLILALEMTWIIMSTKFVLNCRICNTDFELVLKLALELTVN